jgi:hypothetical protein
MRFCDDCAWAECGHFGVCGRDVLRPIEGQLEAIERGEPPPVQPMFIGVDLSTRPDLAVRFEETRNFPPRVVAFREVEDG